MRLDLSLRDLPLPQLSELPLRGPSRKLLEIQSRNEARWAQGKTSKEFQNRKKRLRERLQAAVRPGERLSHERLFEIVRTEVGWHRLLLAIYLDDLGKDWLPAFNKRVAEEVIGESGASWHASRRRQVTQFFFRHFDSIGALASVSKRLRESYAAVSAEPNAAARVWAVHRERVFDPEGPVKMASQARAGETLESLRERFAVPAEGRFTESLVQLYLLESLNRCGLGDEPPTLAQIEAARTETALGSLLLGAAALRIIVRRVATDAGGRWPEGWQKWIVRLGCDPRLGRASGEVARWWGWASDAELRLAQQGVIGASLGFFLKFLDGTVPASQWRERRKFLDSLFEAGKILDVRLILNWESMERLEPRLRDPWSIARLDATSRNTCIIVLRCSDDVSILEGTHTYGLRAFNKRLPIPGFWERARNEFDDCELRISPTDCPIFIRHSGEWIWKFFDELRDTFHVEWGDVRI